MALRWRYSDGSFADPTPEVGDPTSGWWWGECAFELRSHVYREALREQQQRLGYYAFMRKAAEERKLREQAKAEKVQEAAQQAALRREAWKQKEAERALRRNSPEGKAKAKRRAAMAEAREASKPPPHTVAQLIERTMARRAAWLAGRDLASSDALDALETWEALAS
jgi:hypothetical protein